MIIFYLPHSINVLPPVFVVLLHSFSLILQSCYSHGQAETSRSMKVNASPFPIIHKLPITCFTEAFNVDFVETFLALLDAIITDHGCVVSHSFICVLVVKTLAEIVEDD